MDITKSTNFMVIVDSKIQFYTVANFIDRMHGVTLHFNNSFTGKPHVVGYEDTPVIRAYHSVIKKDTLLLDFDKFVNLVTPKENIITKDTSVINRNDLAKLLKTVLNKDMLDVRSAEEWSDILDDLTSNKNIIIR